jgi:hypothetical protein
MKSYCLSLSPSGTHNRTDRSPGYRLCYVTEQYVLSIGNLNELVMTLRHGFDFKQHKAALILCEHVLVQLARAHITFEIST